MNKKRLKFKIEILQQALTDLVKQCELDNHLRELHDAITRAEIAEEELRSLKEDNVDNKEKY